MRRCRIRFSSLNKITPFTAPMTFTWYPLWLAGEPSTVGAASQSCFPQAVLAGSEQVALEASGRRPRPSGPRKKGSGDPKADRELPPGKFRRVGLRKQRASASLQTERRAPPRRCSCRANGLVDRERRPPGRSEVCSRSYREGLSGVAVNAIEIGPLIEHSARELGAIVELKCFARSRSRSTSPRPGKPTDNEKNGGASTTRIDLIQHSAT